MAPTDVPRTPFPLPAARRRACARAARPCGLAVAVALAVALGLLGGCSETARLSESAVTGPAPTLLAPVRRLVPTVDVAPAVGWPAGGSPAVAEGLQVTAFANALDHPRWLLPLPNGDVLVAESNRPRTAAPEDSGPVDRLRAWVMARVMKRAGALTPSADRITLLRDADGDGVAEFRSTFARGLPSPFGLALVGPWLYVGVADGVLRLPYEAGATQAGAAPQRVAWLPAGANHHWTKSLVASADGRRLYSGVGSNSNVGERGLEAEIGRAAIWEIDLESGAARVHASGLRNPVGLAFAPQGASDPMLFAVVNERDELGSDLVPDYLTAIQPGGFYGWPWFYWGAHVDTRAPGPPPATTTTTPPLRPDFALGSHVAPLGLAWQGDSASWPEGLRGGFFVGLHGSWNRKPLAGYQVVFVALRDGRPVLPVRPVATGFLNPAGQAQGRPAGVAVDPRGGLLIADDVGNTVWRVAPAAAALPMLRPASSPSSAPETPATPVTPVTSNGPTEPNGPASAGVTVGR